jgi:SAM-dependent methyltransferase
MPSLTSNLHLVFDSTSRTAIKAYQAVMRKGRSRAGLGASLPGGQVFLEAEIVADRDGFEILRSGDTRHSMWRSVEWRLLRDLASGMARPILDLGCGDGGFGSKLTDRLEYGIDGDADAVGRCDPAVYGTVYTADLRQPLPIPDQSIATILSNSTLEHVDPLAPAIASAARSLRRGGRLVATVPTRGLTSAIADVYGADFARTMNETWGHHNLWTWAQWEELLRAEGFSQVTFRGYLSRPAIAWHCRRNLTPWPQLARRRADWLWHHDLPAIRRHIEESLQVTDESQTTCVLIDAIKD